MPSRTIATLDKAVGLVLDVAQIIVMMVLFKEAVSIIDEYQRC